MSLSRILKDCEEFSEPIEMKLRMENSTKTANQLTYSYKHTIKQGHIVFDRQDNDRVIAVCPTPQDACFIALACDRYWNREPFSASQAATVDPAASGPTENVERSEPTSSTT